MKKIVMMFVMVMMLAFSAVCSASNGKVLDSEEALAAKFLNGDFKAVSAVMSDDMKKNWDEKAYANFKEQITKNFGKINTNQLIVVEKHKDADILLYQVASEKVPAARFVFLFSVKGEKAMLSDFNILLPQQKDAVAEKK